MNEIEETIKQEISNLENKINEKIYLIIKYKLVNANFKMITFLLLSCYLFINSGRTHDIFMWFIGFFPLITINR
ncbi:MAG: hypothetical protein KatS3mg068_1215 [Candidatus Sericytochromatia bacterium]|nr:MAG: hypothetical protein KatS3mg068_1215 [Candidatus Sericytochromatia bacterium]